ncbi:hypothetical protein [Chitinophaga alhagiae]|uniref:hypothetical protein n=1 Tax=Chitinophaga alhagiae TaxID=2203219 RepID=UPI0013005FE8|nr:hypothetical protein [Chitinophaga alhagiae]
MKKLIYVLACCSLLACGNNNREKQPQQTAVPPMEDSAIQTTGANPPPVSTDEQQFRTFFGSFQHAVTGTHDTLLQSMIRFPLPVDNAGTELKRAEFRSREAQIFNGDVIRLLPTAGDANITEIDGNNATAYYKKLRAGTDPGTAMYEVHMEYPDQNSSKQGFFTFVFGKVGGQYKLIGYHRNMPVKA